MKQSELINQIDHRTNEMEEIFHRLYYIIEFKKLRLIVVGQITSNAKTMKIIDEIHNKSLKRTQIIKSVLIKDLPFDNNQQQNFNSFIKRWDNLIDYNKEYVNLLPAKCFDYYSIDCMINAYDEIITNAIEELKFKHFKELKKYY